jgi:hypothetical protein
MWCVDQGCWIQDARASRGAAASHASCSTSSSDRCAAHLAQSSMQPRAGVFGDHGPPNPTPCCRHRVQVTIAGGVGHPHIKKLAYDLCNAVPLLDADYSLLLDGMKVGVFLWWSVCR